MDDHIKVLQGGGIFLGLLMAWILFLMGCNGLPDKRAKQVEKAVVVPDNYVAEFDEPLQVASTLLEIFDDAELSALIDQALANNPNLLIALAQMEETGFNLAKVRGEYWPEFSANGSASRSGGNAIRTTKIYSASLDVSWEIDVWGRIRSSVDAAGFDLAAAEGDFEAAKQSLVAQTMQSWFSLIATVKLLDLAERQLESFESTRRLVERRYEVGTSTLADLELAQTDAANARADYEARIDDRDQAARSLQALLGNYPDQSLNASSDWPSLDRSVPAGLPSELLLARPDIIAAYESVLASDARVSVAYADLFPSFALTGSGGRQSDTFSDLGRSAFDVWSLAGGLSAPIFRGGALRAELGAASKRAEQSYQNYRSVLINAFREVEDALSSESYLKREETERLEALEAARRAEQLTRREYEEGISDILTLLETQRRVFTTEESTINLHSARLINRVRLALALGKGV
ncbi:MAG: TolC family protein [Verrucomicrobiota bacterium]